MQLQILSFGAAYALHKHAYTQKVVVKVLPHSLVLAWIWIILQADCLLRTFRYLQFTPLCDWEHYSLFSLMRLSFS